MEDLRIARDILKAKNVNENVSCIVLAVTFSSFTCKIGFCSFPFSSFSKIHKIYRKIII